LVGVGVFDGVNVGVGVFDGVNVGVGVGVDVGHCVMTSLSFKIFTF